MTEKIVSQLDQSGYFIGAVVAEESPLEPGVFLLPGGAIEVDPPDIPDRKRAIWQGEAWAYVSPVDESPDTPPVNGIPQEVTMRQARLALLSKGHLQAVEAAINALSSPSKEAARIEWEYAQVVRRSDPLVEMLAQALGLDAEQLDTLFTTAAGL